MRVKVDPMRQRSLFFGKKVRLALQNLHEFCPKEGYYLSNSFGKDSVVLEALTIIAGVKHDSHFHRTSVDPPDLIRWGRAVYPEVKIEKPPDSMFKLILYHGCPPLRTMRYCCRVFKESQGEGRTVLTGVRRAESKTRADRQLVSQCPSLGKWIVNPLVEWSEVEIWDFIHTYGVPYSPLYDEGWRRLGCIGCPCAYFKTRLREFERWPRFFRAYLRCFDRLVIEKEKTWKTGEEVMRWWLEEPYWTAKEHEIFNRLMSNVLDISAKER